MMTPLGEILRRERQERGQLLGEMAKLFGMSSPYLSQIETGKRAVPEGFDERVIRTLGLDYSSANELRRAVALSRSEYEISLTQDASFDDRALAHDLAASFARLSSNEKRQIHDILKEKNSA